MSADKPVDNSDQSEDLPEGQGEQTDANKKDSDLLESDSSLPKEPAKAQAPEDAGEIDAPPVKKKSGKGKLFLIFFLLFLLLGAAAGGWYFAQKQMQKQQAGIGDAMGAQLSALNAELGELRRQIAEQESANANTRSALLASTNQTEAQLLSLADRISQSESTSSGDWLLAEAEYLLRIANQRLVTSQDIAGAIEMMKAADTILMELAYPELTEVRRQLVADLTRLGMVRPVDYEGIYFALDALLPSVAALSLSNVERLENADFEDSEVQGWRQYWSMIKRALSPYVVINSSADEPQYLISDDQESLVKSQIQLQVRQAQLAMMSAKESLYQAALDNAASQVESIFADDARSYPLTESLRELANRPVSSESLDISESIRALGAVVDQLARVQPLTNAGSPGQSSGQ